MISVEEKIKMYQEKKNFIEAISNVFKTVKHNSSVESISYEVYTKDFDGRVGYYEWLIIHYTGGAYSANIANGNSNTANLRIIASQTDSGYYDDVPDYKSLEEKGWERVALEN